MKDVAKVALIDDHLLFRSGLASILSSNQIEVVLDAENGADMIEKLKQLKKSCLPNIFIVDINMPIMDGFETVSWLNQNYPECKLIILTMYNEPEIVMKMIRLGVKSYLTKNLSPSELFQAISLVNDNKFYFPNEITGIIVSSNQSLKESIDRTTRLSLTEREVQLLQLMCTEMTYKEIADKLHVSPRTVDVYRDNLFAKLNVKSRAGLILKAIKMNLITIND